MFATFDGTGGTYFTRAALTATQSYPFWVSAQVRLYMRADYATAYTIWASELSDVTNGTSCEIFHMVPISTVADGSSSTNTTSPEAIIQDPYWENVVCEFRSTTDRRIWINGVQEATSSTSRAISIASGLFRIGIRGSGVQPFKGSIANVVVGTGVLRAADMTLLSTIGGNYALVAPTGGAVTNWFKLDGDGSDSIGTETLTDHGGVSYTTGSPAVRSQPTVSDIIYETHKQTTLLSGTPTVLAGQTPPISTSGWSNFASCEWLNISFTGNVSAWNTRVYHFIPTTPVIPGGHCVFVDGGHEAVASWSAHNEDALIQQLVAAGYAVAVTELPLEGVTDPGYTGGDQLHDGFWSSWNATTANPLERWHGPSAIALNNLSPRYAKISAAGLSGGGYRYTHYAAMDRRINHAIICVRGSIADRRAIEAGYDFEQRVRPNGWKSEEFYRLAASPNRRLWFVYHPTDSCCFRKFDDGSSGNGAYLDISGYATKFLAPIMAEFPRSDVQAFESLGGSTHAYDQWEIDNVIFPALSTALMPIATSYYYQGGGHI